MLDLGFLEVLQNILCMQKLVLVNHLCGYFLVSKKINVSQGSIVKRHRSETFIWYFLELCSVKFYLMNAVLSNNKNRLWD